MEENGNDKRFQDHDASPGGGQRAARGGQSLQRNLQSEPASAQKVDQAQSKSINEKLNQK
eukprot:CAMPEP_0181474204 /NCGR_PEP_ID=MMETSP1110-20121109/40526_1 /TAXON_ID=174948 /ORGANISM="Symbiodinium sp., Strain CCMP421" /LENGTH=59 /DNA_ID=CAMNT_0023599359 /DNA_START=101 /DNA_END=280 /DNA_ORIENTATION=-